jgi:hypothetical protein
MDGRGARRTHFVQHRRHTAARYLPSGFAAGKPAADDMNWPQSLRHASKLCRCLQHDNIRDEDIGARC